MFSERGKELLKDFPGVTYLDTGVTSTRNRTRFLEMSVPKEHATNQNLHKIATAVCYALGYYGGSLSSKKHETDTHVVYYAQGNFD